MARMTRHPTSIQHPLPISHALPRGVIEKKRKVLFEQSREQSRKGYKPDEKALSASESVAAAYKVRKLLGEMGDKVRNQMLQAGYRNPSAPVKYMVAR